ncbi:MAG: hypothetical protein ACTSQY_09980, partial [Candidatus Odinarchaeia archaeon]
MANNTSLEYLATMDPGLTALSNLLQQSRQIDLLKQKQAQDLLQFKEELKLKQLYDLMKQQMGEELKRETWRMQEEYKGRPEYMGRIEREAE